MFVDAADAKYVGKLQGKHELKTTAISLTGHHFAAILMDAKYVISLLRLDAILDQQVKLREDELDLIEGEVEEPLKATFEDGNSIFTCIVYFD